jgi:uncharacterized protein (DUF58 family)
LVTATVGAALTTAGMLLGYPELLAVGLACGAVLVLAVAWRLLRPDLSVTRTIEPQRVDEGEQAQSRLTVTNIRRRRTPPLAAYELIAGKRIPIALPSLGGGQNFSATQALPTAHRGKHVIPPLTLGYSDPFRLIQVDIKHGTRSTLWVYPRVHYLAALPSGGMRDLDGTTSSSSPQGGVAFHSLREYQAGDDWRLIHWQSTARTDRLMVKHNVVPDEVQHLVVLNTSAEAYSDNEAFEAAVRIAASWCVAAVREGCVVRMSTTGGDSALYVPTGRSRGRPVAVLDLLTEVTSSDVDPGIAALGSLISTEHSMALGVVTGRASAAHLASLQAVRARVASLSLARVGGSHPEIDFALRGVLAVSASGSDEFAARWNELIRR